MNRLLSALLVAVGVLAWPRLAQATYSIHCSNTRVTLIVNYSGEGEFVAIAYSEQDEPDPAYLEPTFWRMAGQQVLALRERADADRRPFHLGIRGRHAVLIFRQQRHFLRCGWDTE
ncbi:hypothetical protein [Sorangium sp. So ce176]|uniref:hypothetical protein n=1 Tax=Sorangium sp. So ce176 TaxID=3133286 RepID=UPI003F5F27F2